MSEVAIIGGGPAGLTAAYYLQALGSSHKPVILESGDMVGGIARTDSYAGCRFDIGGHRFFTKVPEIERIWREVCGEDLLVRPRRSRIFYGGKFFDYPLKITNALRQLGLYESAFIVGSYVRWRIFPHADESTYQKWVTNRFGRRLFRLFFKSYTEKVWGIPCSEIRADWAMQRIKNLSLKKALWNAVSGANDTTSLIEKFYYPRLGPGMMWEKMRDRILARGGEVHMRSSVRSIARDGNRITGIEVEHRGVEGGKVETRVVTADHYVSSMALRDLILMLNPPPPPEVVEAARRLQYRDFLIVVLILDRTAPFPDNWIYIHSQDVKVGRIQNFGAWSPEMLADPDKASIGMEYFLNITDELWNLPDGDLVAMAAAELEKIGLASAKAVVDGTVIRQPKAYPVYDGAYKEALAIIKDWLSTLENLQTVGRNGLHRYNNQDHSMLTAMLAARNILGEKNDLWEVNLERSYHEEFQTKPALPRDFGERSLVRTQ